MDMDTGMFFDKCPGALPLYEALEAEIHSRFDNVRIKVGKTQISFYNKHLFAAASLPMRKIKDRPSVYLIVTFGLDHQVQDARVAYSVEPYPNRWTHHVIVETADEIDSQLIDWIEQAYNFSLIK